LAAVGFLIRLESVASPQTPQEAIGELVTIAQRLDVGVISDVNGVDAFAFPSTDPADAIRLWEQGRLDVKSHREEDLAPPRCAKCGKFLTGVRKEMRLSRCAKCER
jgi:hypothetical protein